MKLRINRSAQNARRYRNGNYLAIGFLPLYLLTWPGIGFAEETPQKRGEVIDAVVEQLQQMEDKTIDKKPETENLEAESVPFAEDEKATVSTAKETGNQEVESVDADNTPQPPEKDNEDKKETATSIEVTKQEDTKSQSSASSSTAGNTPTSGWLYLGNYVSGQWKDKTVDINVIPIPGDICSVLVGVNLRRNMPGKPEYSRILKTLASNNQVRIEEVKASGKSSHYWSRVTLVDKP